jgi:carboxypeptidase C (cathepsin A)
MPDEETKKPESTTPETAAPAKEEAPPVKTQHTLNLGRGKKLNYTATAGRMPMKNAQGETEAHIYFTAYTLDGVSDVARRPLTFVFNGGPGSASVWLHLGALGPQRVKMHDEGWMPTPPFELEANPNTWLDQTDLVFVDPVGTGYSRATKPEHNKKFWGLKGDLESVGEFIRLYLVQNGRWTSPLFLAGESYGTTRSAGLAGHLINKGIAFNGIVLISTVLNFQTLHFDRGNDLPYSVYLPTYAATAWYHGKLAPELQKRPLKDVLREVEAYAATDYTVALMKGDRLTADERAAVVQKVASYTGLSPEYIDLTNLRVDIMRFCKELMRNKRLTVGRLDSRFTAEDATPVSEMFEFDPSMTAIMPPYTAMFNAYARGTLKYESDVEYQALSFEVNQNWEYDKGQYPDTSDMLRSAFAKNPHMRLFVAQGYFDLATPHFAAEYTLNHMDLPSKARANITWSYYEAGHMFYLDVKSLAQFRKDLTPFLKI